MSARLGPFELVELIGVGGMGKVWKAVHPETRVRAAVKVLTGEGSHTEALRRALRREARAVARLHHPGVVLVLDIGQVTEPVEGLRPGCPWMAMEYASGGTLDDSGPLPWPDLRAVLLGVLDALAHAHARGLIHRDLKPGNILRCTESDSRPGLKLSDFGLATAIDWHVQSGSLAHIAGTLHYIAPEQLLGNWRDYGPWTDLYALGCLAWRLATGRVPFASLSGSALMRAQLLEAPGPFQPACPMPPGFEVWIRRLLAKAPSDRFAFAADAAWRLGGLPDVEPVEEPRHFATSAEPVQGATDVITVTLGLPTGAHSAAARPTVSEAPPIPQTWRRRTAPAAPPRLVGAGGGLVGLRQVQLVGRETARDRLWGVLRAAVEKKRPHIVVIEGAEGVGKSRLAEWLVTRAAELGIARGLRTAFRHDEPAPSAIRRLVEQGLTTRELDEDEIEERLEDVLPDFGHRELLLAALTVEGGSSAAYPVFLEAIEALAQVRPPIVWLDDVHTRSDSLEFAARMLERFAGPAVLVACATGPVPTWRTHAEDVVHIGPLRPRELGELVRRHLPLERLLLRDLCTRAAGNPKLALALLEEWVRGGRLRMTPRGFRLQGELTAGTDLADAYDARVAASIEGLPESALVALERLAVAGRPLALDVWESLGVERTVIDALVDRLTTEGRATVFAGRIELEGGLYRECLLARARSAGRVAGHHRALADWGLAHEVASEGLGVHLEAAGRPARAIGVWTTAARRALAQRRVDTASALLDRLEKRVAPPDPRAVEIAELRVEAEWMAGSLTDAYRRSSALIAELAGRAPESLQVLHGRILSERREVDRSRNILAGIEAAEAREALAMAELERGEKDAALAILEGATDPAANAIRAVAGDEVTEALLTSVADPRLQARLWVCAAGTCCERVTALRRAVRLQDGIAAALALPTRVELCWALFEGGSWEELGRELGVARRGTLQGPQALAADAMGLVVHASDGTWPRFDLGLRAVARALGSHSDRRIVGCLERAGDLANAAGLRERGDNAHRLARGLARQVGDAVVEARLDARIRPLKALSRDADARDDGGG